MGEAGWLSGDGKYKEHEHGRKGRQAHTDNGIFYDLGNHGYLLSMEQY